MLARWKFIRIYSAVLLQSPARLHAGVIYDVEWETSPRCCLAAVLSLESYHVISSLLEHFGVVGSWKLLGRPDLCDHRRAGVHWTRRGQVSNWTLWREGNRKREQENQLSRHGPGQRTVQEWQGGSVRWLPAVWLLVAGLLATFQWEKKRRPVVWLSPHTVYTRSVGRSGL